MNEEPNRVVHSLPIINHEGVMVDMLDSAHYSLPILSEESLLEQIGSEAMLMLSTDVNVASLIHYSVEPSTIESFEEFDVSCAIDEFSCSTQFGE